LPFAPLAAFVRGGKEYKRIEPDFVLLKNGVLTVVEVDGDTVHLETPAQAHERTAMLEYEGARVIRVSASKCATPELASQYVRQLIQVIAKQQASR
jgi:very-short-patch-repair endonuclease